jgi:solute carrier family 25 uncoupling protein 27
MNQSYKKLLLIQSSACIAETSTYPIDYIKTKMQINNQKLSVFDIGRDIIQKERKLQVYDGLKPSLLRHCIYTTLRISIYENLRESLKSDKNSLSMSQKYLIGGTSGGLAQLVASPFDLLKIRYITKIDKQNVSVYKTFKNIYVENGIRGLWKGVSPNVSRAVLVNLGELATYDQAKQNLRSCLKIEDSTPLHAMSSLCSGFVASVCCTPADVIKSRMMQTKSPYRGIIDCIHKTVTEEGISALYKGFYPIWFRLAPWQLIFWLTYERLRLISGLESF